MAYKYKIHTNTNQKNNIFKSIFGCLRFLYNKMLSDSMEYYEKVKKSFSINPGKYKNKFSF
ncbi:helix-turn-helix domain-containing protein (plasmid) [Borreliella finlandensis]|uniref:helix-turn-helix domain-containing protein n=1 Tax=Borreliella finlandensis TaxID=498741 RepID=UPI00264783B2|nr:helix-turn-helix domain-containing protein [Borreliella finlandensis]WKC89472.1 helix-turn-helix domain-containing protein [Borreliella finlandensis]